MSAKTIGISLQESSLKKLDSLAKAEERGNRSAMVEKLVERASSGNGSAPDVRIDGRRFVPARKA